ncbi:MAG: branched-chain amino acid ABC transporter permease [Burkholderiales bacterium]|nr:branched-chain amino acid ABC transporter permease [Burkholderiales bacterium]
MSPIQLAVDALSLGGQFALIALGIGLIFGVMRMINFAHGDLITFGAYALVVPSAADMAVPFVGAWSAWFLIPSTLGIVMLATLAGERVAFRPLRRRHADGTSLLISSFAVGYLIQSVILFVHTGRPKSVSIFPGLTRHLEIASVRVSLIDVVTILVTIALLLVVLTFLRFTRAGLHLRAASEDFSMAKLLGVRADRVIFVAFGISGLLAGVVSLLYVAKTGVLDSRMGVPLAIAGFVGTVIGGMGNLAGAVAGGLFLGIASTLLQALLPEALRPARDAFVYGLVIVILLVRPGGLFVPRNAAVRI